MTFDELIIPFLTFMLGALISQSVYTWKFSNKFTEMATIVKGLIDNSARQSDLDNLIKVVDSLAVSVKDIRVDTPPCSFHIDLDKRVVRAEGQIETILTERTQ